MPTLPVRSSPNKGEPYRMFTPFHRAWLSRPRDLRPEEGNGLITEATGAGIPEAPCEYPAGEEPAPGRLAEFINRVNRYPDERDRPDLDSTSRLRIDLSTDGQGRRPSSSRSNRGRRAPRPSPDSWPGATSTATSLPSCPKPSTRRCARNTRTWGGSMTR